MLWNINRNSCVIYRIMPFSNPDFKQLLCSVARPLCDSWISCFKWPLMVDGYTTARRGQSFHHYTKCNSQPINGQCTNHRIANLLFDGPSPPLPSRGKGGARSQHALRTCETTLSECCYCSACWRTDGLALTVCFLWQLVGLDWTGLSWWDAIYVAALHLNWNVWPEWWYAVVVVTGAVVVVSAGVVVVFTGVVVVHSFIHSILINPH